MDCVFCKETKRGYFFVVVISRAHTHVHSRERELILFVVCYRSHITQQRSNKSVQAECFFFDVEFEFVFFPLAPSSKVAPYIPFELKYAPVFCWERSALVGQNQWASILE